MKHKIILVLVSSLLLFQIGCIQTVVWFTKKTANWEYVDKAWGGAIAGPVELHDQNLIIPITLWIHNASRPDSGICVYDPSGYVKGSRIYITLKQGLCNQTAAHSIEAKIKKPPVGEYDIVYDDSAANYPVLGKATIPK
jgi:hypothetical protein